MATTTKPARGAALLDAAVSTVFRCPGCHVPGKVPSSVKKVRCRECATVIRFPLATASSVTVRPPGAAGSTAASGSTVVTRPVDPTARDAAEARRRGDPAADAALFVTLLLVVAGGAIAYFYFADEVSLRAIAIACLVPLKLARIVQGPKTRA